MAQSYYIYKIKKKLKKESFDTMSAHKIIKSDD